ncbi:MAG: hypothetical protein ACLVJH_04750 [Faecalibacterium prausnitzii]
MQRTEKYFEQDAFRTECESVILAAEPDEKTGGGRIALDGTVFYPEGGGQPADRGTLTLPDGTVLRVSDVHEQDGRHLAHGGCPARCRRARRSRCRLHRLGLAL